MLQSQLRQRGQAESAGFRGVIMSLLNEVQKSNEAHRGVLPRYCGCFCRLLYGSAFCSQQTKLRQESGRGLCGSSREGDTRRYFHA